MEGKHSVIESIEPFQDQSLFLFNEILMEWLLKRMVWDNIIINPLAKNRLAQINSPNFDIQGKVQGNNIIICSEELAWVVLA
jgi:hypothetical protein